MDKRTADALYFMCIGGSLVMMLVGLFVMIGVSPVIFGVGGFCLFVFFATWSPFHENGGHH